jgi:hypothetical protein
MKKLSIIFFFFGLSNIVFSQSQTIEPKKGILSGSFESNGQWYLNDLERKITHDSVPIRSNNYLFFKYNYDKWTAGAQVESYLQEALLNYNPKLKGTNIATYYTNFHAKKVDITAGYFYEQFGSGLLLRSFEDRSLGINNAIRGGKIIYSPNENITLTALYGNHRTGFSVSKSTVLGFNSEINLSSLLKEQEFELSLGLSYVGRYEKTDLVNTKFNDLTNAFSGRLNLSKKSFYINSEVNFKAKDAVLLNISNKISNSFVKPGSAYLLNFGYSKKGFGFDTTLRRLENMLFLSERVPEVVGVERTSLFYNDRFMNFLPSLTKQHHSALSNIYVYQAQSQVNIDPSNGIAKAGEIGGQVDFFYELKKGTDLGGKYGTKISINGSNWFNLGGTYQVFDADGDYVPNYKTNFFESREKYYSDYNIEISKKLSPKVNSSFAFINQYYNNRYITGAANLLIKTNILFAETTVKFQKNKALTFGLEHMWADNDRKNWAALSAEYNHNTNWSIFITDMYNYGYDPKADLISHEVDSFKIHFYNLGTSYKKGSTRLALSYGRQRGGLVCAGGVCRFVPPSTGVSLSISTVL